jgi:hypothetical protein
MNTISVVTRGLQNWIQNGWTQKMNGGVLTIAAILLLWLLLNCGCEATLQNAGPSAPDYRQLVPVEPNVPPPTVPWKG